ncbi:MAG: flavin reductase family protein [Christensenellales bacterium]|jgi:flavin reductase (DIM6/NTAB) family NADH-FMN oxidoreductase RutF
MTDLEMLNAFSIPLYEALKGPGAFLTAGADKPNTMTIGWATVGIVWSLPIVTVLVRHSRYTHEAIESGDAFTVSVPHPGQMKRELAYLGTKSGRDGDKYAAMGLSLLPGRKVPTPVIAGCQIHAECRILYKQSLDPLLLDEAVNQRVYVKQSRPWDYHSVYYGQLLDVYQEK